LSVSPLELTNLFLDTTKLAFLSSPLAQSLITAQQLDIVTSKFPAEQQAKDHFAT
jgi:hypothetical protein